MRDQVSDHVQRGVYLAARMISDYDVSRQHYEQTFPEARVDLDRRDGAPVCASYCVEGRMSKAFNEDWNLSMVERSLTGKLAETPTLQFAHEDRDANLAICAGHEGCVGVKQAIAELERLYDQVDQNPELIQELISKRCAEMNPAIHPGERRIYDLLCSGGVALYEALKHQSGVQATNAAMAEGWARQQVYAALENERVYNLVRQGRLVLASAMVHFPDNDLQKTTLTMVVTGDGEEIEVHHGSGIMDAFEGMVSEAFRDEGGNVDRDQMMNRCDHMWVSNQSSGVKSLEHG